MAAIEGCYMTNALATPNMEEWSGAGSDMPAKTNIVGSLDRATDDTVRPMKSILLVSNICIW